MAAPTPVSAYLHSAAMVKAGVFLLARHYPVLSGTDLWLILVGGTGAVTFVYGAYVALLKHDFKGLLAYSTVSHLGLITLLFGLDTPMSAVTAVFHTINHAIFKASLFMAAGIIDHECGTRDMRRLSGMFKYMPWTATLGILAAGSMAGVPLLTGFLSKEMFFVETVGHPQFQGVAAWLLPVFATVAGMLPVAYSARFIHDVFFNGEPIELPRSPREPARWMRFPVEALVGLVLLVGCFPQLFVGPVLYAAPGAVLPLGVPEFKLAVWHGWNLPLVMSIAAFRLGLPQALVLTAIVIGFGMTAYLIALALRAKGESGTDHVDAGEKKAMSHLPILSFLIPFVAAILLLLAGGRHPERDDHERYDGLRHTALHYRSVRRYGPRQYRLAATGHGPDRDRHGSQGTSRACPQCG